MNKSISILAGSFIFASGINAQDGKIEKFKKHQISEPLVTEIHTADPSAHVFDGKIYIYPSHDVNEGKVYDSPGGAFRMVDYHVFSIDKVGAEVTDHGPVLHVDDVPWATKQMWAPDAAEKEGKYYLYFPAKDHLDLFRIGVAVGDSPTGPFKAQPDAIKGSYSIDPSVFKDDDGSHYMYFGGIDGGQLQHYRGNKFGVHYRFPDENKPALLPRIAKMSDNMLEFAGPAKEVQIIDKNGELLKGSDGAKRFFEAAWVHKYKGTYYFSYSTGGTHLICYATGDNPYGPFTYQGIVLKPVLGWTNHHSICEFEGKWYLFYHDSILSNGNTNLRSIKMTELKHDAEGKIMTIDAYGGVLPKK
ncbi:MAG: glycoside hydrolase family 43 protein [Verrucomicrobiae bacterium]|nr:glycoside hydrolase family 43 protein [Verrucomicrobiae bacterium]NNJ42868.1 glycoside hydrolase family 43 protein [Akkermansiaceae bacterium]